MIKNSMNLICSRILCVKNQLLCLATVFLLGGVATSQNQPTAGVQASVGEIGAGTVSLTAKGVLPKPPLFFNATANAKVRVTASAVNHDIALAIKVLQGRPEVITLGLEGAGEIKSVTGTGLADWAVRKDVATGKRFLDLVPKLVKGKPGPVALNLTIKAQHKFESLPVTAQILTLTPGKSAGFSFKLQIDDGALETRVTKISGMLPLENEGGYHSTGMNNLTLQIFPSGAAPAGIELRGARITGTIDEKSRSATLIYTATAHVTRKGKVDFLSGKAAISSIQLDAEYSLSLTNSSGYQLGFDSAGTFPVRLEMIARIDDAASGWVGWKTISFSTPQGAVVPVELDGLGGSVKFAENLPIYPRLLPTASDASLRYGGFLPATGQCLLAWKAGRKAGEGKLAFTSKGLTDVAVAAGLLRQVSQIELKVLQGKINDVSLRMDGPGEVIDVQGTNIAGWSVEADQDGARILRLRLSVPLEDGGIISVRSQQALGKFPVTASPLRLTPVGMLRHSGYVRLSNSGSVRLETTNVQGMMQLSPTQYPGRKISARQIFVYRYPAADYSWQVQADQILPEVSLNQVLIYQQLESDRVIRATVELDIREAPLREWEMRIPDRYAVASLKGAEIADYVVGTAVENGHRDVKVLFKKAVSGRQLVMLRLEKNSPAKAGLWKLPVIDYPGAKAVRGHLGVSTAAGWRVVPNKVNKLTETPLSYFPVKDTDIQQTYRMREQGWSAEVKIDAREQSVQADVFHLYSLKEGMAYGSVLLNYFVVGAPVNEWELSIPESFGNVTIEGQNVRQWRRADGDKVIVQLEQPVSGAATLLITFENAMSARGGKLSLGEVRPLNVQTESGFIEVVSPILMKHKITKTAPGLLQVSSQELPAEFRMLTTAPAIDAWQYAARPFELEIDIALYDQGETLDQVVDFASLETSVSRDGQVMTEARMYIRTRGRQALRMTLPPKTKLWDARADGRTITAREDGDQLLLPLPAGDDPNKPVHLVIRYGGDPEGGSKVVLGAPTLAAPVIINGWKVSAEKGRLLLPAGDSDHAVIRREPLMQTGFESLQGRGMDLLGIGVLFLSGVMFLRAKNPAGWKQFVSALWLLAVVLLAVWLARSISQERRINQRFVEITAQVVSPDSPVTVTLKNIAPWKAMVSWLGIAAAAVGAVAFIGSLVVKKWSHLWLRALAGAAVAGGILAQRGGGVLFFGLIAIVALLLLILALYRGFKDGGRYLRERAERRRIARDEASEAIALGSADGVTKLLVIATTVVGICFGISGQTHAANDPAPALAVLNQTWKIENNRLYAKLDISVRGEAGASHLLLREPAVLTAFNSDGLRVSKIKRGKETVWMIAAERAGALTATASFEMPVRPQFLLPTGSAAVQEISAEIDVAGLEIYSTAAVRSVPRSGLADGKSGVDLVLAPLPKITMGIRPRGRDIDAEETKFYAEVANLYLPSPGVVDGVHRVTIRPSSGKVNSLVLTVPEGFAVSEVAGAVASWRFDPAGRQLTVDLSAAQSRVFSIFVETQSGLGALPAAVNLQSLTVADDAGETNMIGLAFGQEAQPGKITATDLSVVNVDDFDRGLIPAVKKKPLGILHKVYRSASGAGSLSLQVAPVMPEVRVVSRQELSLGSERILLSAALDVSITRAGIFKLSFALPDGMEVESLSGGSLSHWTESEQDMNGKKTRIVTLHLTGKTLGAQQFALTLSGQPVSGKNAWSVPKLLLDQAVRQSGQLMVIPEKGIRVRAIDRKNVSRMTIQSSPRNAQTKQMQARVKQSGGLAFRILQKEWALTLGIEKLDPWITASVLHEVTLREGQTRTRLAAVYQIEHASVKSIRVQIPALTEEEQRTVRASGSAVKEIVNVKDDLWEIRFRRGILGTVAVQIEFQRGADRGKGGAEEVRPAVFLAAKRLTYFMVVRTTGRLDMRANNPAGGWRRSDWTAVPKSLRNPADTSVPDLCYRLNEPEGTLKVSLKRHQMADTLKLRVTGGKMKTIFSPVGETLTAVRLETRVLQKSTLKISLPEKSSLYNVLVNDEPVHVVKEGDDHLFHVSPPPVETEPAIVSLVYSTPASDGNIRLAAPGFNVPLEFLTWDVLVPEGYRLENHSGGFQLRGSQGVTDYTIKDYLDAIRSNRSEEAQKGQESLQKANDYLRQGKRKEAAKELSKVTKNRAVDAASNEDARVQLRQLQTQQALWGLNSRRQRIYLDNKAAGNGIRFNADLEDSAVNNPLFKGQQEFDVRQVDDFLRGNSLEEKKSLKSIASRLVTQQLATEPAPQTISTIVRGRGEVLRFTRGVQVAGAKELALELDVTPTNKVPLGKSLFILLGVGIVAAVASRKAA